MCCVGLHLLRSLNARPPGYRSIFDARRGGTERAVSASGGIWHQNGRVPVESHLARSLSFAPAPAPKGRCQWGVAGVAGAAGVARAWRVLAHPAAPLVRLDPVRAGERAAGLAPAPAGREWGALLPARVGLEREALEREALERAGLEREAPAPPARAGLEPEAPLPGLRRGPVTATTLIRRQPRSASLAARPLR